MNKLIKNSIFAITLIFTFMLFGITSVNAAPPGPDDPGVHIGEVTIGTTKTVTWDSSNLGTINIYANSNNQTISSEKIEGITISVTSSGEPIDFYWIPPDNYKMDVYGTGYFTFASSIGNIKKIVITADSGIDWTNANTGWSKSGSTFIWSGTPSETVTLVGDGAGSIEGISTIVFTIEVPVSNVTLNTNGGTINSGNITEYVEGTGASLPTDITREGYTFDGWYASSDFSGNPVTAISTTETGDKEYYAKWIANTYIVTFDANRSTFDGTVTPTSKEVTYGETYGELATVTEIPGYTFEGWYTTDSIQGDAKIESNTVVSITENTTLYAGWRPKSYNITVNLNSPNGVNPDFNGELNPTIKYGQLYSMALQKTPSLNGYNFIGWKDSNNSIIDLNSRYFLTEDSTVYAVWEPIAYTITYENLLDGTNPNTISSYTIEDTITFENPIRTGYTGSWNPTGIASGSTGNKTITAIWEINKYKVTFKDYDGSVLKTQENVEYNTGATAPSNPTREHYTFTGWDKSFNNVTEDLVVTAQYIVDKNTVTFDSNGGSTIDSQLVNYGSKATKPSDPTNGNLHFIGWFVNPTLENIFNAETFVYNTFDFNTEITGNTTLTALWSIRLNINTYGDGQIATGSHGEELEFDDEYSVTSVSELAIIGLYDSFDVEAKANEGYHFVKWTKDGVDYSKNSKVTITLEDDIVELVAVFEIDEFTVTFKDYDGSIIDTQQVAYYTSAFEPDAPTRDGYTFTGWDKSFDNVTKDLVVTAQYILTPGEVEVKEVEGNVGSATVSLNNQNVEDLIELSADEQNAIATGNDIYVFVEVDDISDSVSIKDKELVKTKLEDGSVVGMYLDINLFKQVEGENKVKVEETNAKIKISFEIPESLRSSNRKFYIIRVHGTEVTKIIPTVNGNTLTFETDRFSTYSLAYTDKVEETTPTQTNTTSNPKTGDNVMFYISMLGLSIIGLIGTGFYVIKKRFN